jgi:hypothetical protein
MQALTVDERFAIRELALPGTQERSVPALVEPARPLVVRPTLPLSPFSGFTSVFASAADSASQLGCTGINPRSTAATFGSTP